MKCVKCEKRNESKKRIIKTIQRWYIILDTTLYLFYVFLVIGLCFGLAGFMIGYSLCLDTVMKII